MSSETYAVSMDCPHATTPTVLWHVGVDRAVSAEKQNVWVPRLETWTLDTLRMFLHELAAFLPPHESATVTILAKVDPPKGRPAANGQRRAPRFSDKVKISVTARGWTASVWTWINEKQDAAGKRLGDGSGEWSAPMRAVLLDLAAQSPFPLDGVRVVESADRGVLGLKYPSRRARNRGATSTCQSELQEMANDLKKSIDDMLDGNR